MTADVTNIKCSLTERVILDVTKEKYTLKSTLDTTTLLNYVKLIFVGESDCQNSTDTLFCQAVRRNNLLDGEVTPASTTSPATQTVDCDLIITVSEINTVNTISVGIKL